MYNKDKEKYRSHKSSATYRGIPFKLTFNEWLNIWHLSNHYHERGNKRGQYCMSRFNDTGAYEVGNVFIQLHTENISQAHKNKPAPYAPGRKQVILQETRLKISNALKGRKLSKEHRQKLQLINAGRKGNSPESYAAGWVKRRAAKENKLCME